MSVRSFLAGASAASALVLLTACSSAPPSAASIARKIPGCHPYWRGAIDVQAKQEVTCNDLGGAVWVATFSSAPLERQWLNADGVGAGLCVQGSGWAALIASNSAGDWHYRAARLVVAHAGGRIVTGIGGC